MDFRKLATDKPKGFDARRESVKTCSDERPRSAISPVSRSHVVLGRPQPQGRKIPGHRISTGCATCKRRNKECDEIRPKCSSCQKNWLIYEGYEGSVDSLGSEQRMDFALCTLDGVETKTDRYLLDYFVSTVSKVLPLTNGQVNPFVEVILPMTSGHKGLMHAMLSLSGCHLAKRNPSFLQRYWHHLGRAIECLRAELGGLENDSSLISNATVASIIIMCIQENCEGDTRGAFRPHLTAARLLLVRNRSKCSLSDHFLLQLFNYYDILSSVTSTDRRFVRESGNSDIIKAIVQSKPEPYLRMMVELLSLISSITHLQDDIRTRKEEGIFPTYDQDMLSRATVIELTLRSWQHASFSGHDDVLTARIFQLSIWIYLHRSLHGSEPSTKVNLVIDEALGCLRALPSDSGVYRTLLMPLFLLGCAAFDPVQRSGINDAFQRLNSYLEFGNVELARQIVCRIWGLMDARDDRSSDWRAVMQNMNYDFIVA